MHKLVNIIYIIEFFALYSIYTIIYVKQIYVQTYEYKWGAFRRQARDTYVFAS